MTVWLMQTSPSSSSLIPLLSSCFVILCAGLPMTFPLYTASFRDVLGYTQTQINTINLANLAGQFLFYPLIGAGSDRVGPHLIAAIGPLFIITGLFGAAHAYEHRLSYTFLSAAFLSIGIGASCGYMSAMSVCAKSFRGAKGLAISVPVCCYGLALLLYTSLFQTCFQDGESQDIPGFWRALTLVSTLAIAVGFFGMRVPTPQAQQSMDPDTQPLLQPAGAEDASVPGHSPPPSFFTDGTTGLFIIGYICLAGSTETLVANMGSVLESIVAARASPYHASTAVSIFAICSTAARLCAGLSSDALAARQYSRCHVSIWLVAIPMSITLFMLAALRVDGARFYIIAGINGFCYGSLYASGPTIAAIVWGLKDFGRNWGVLSYSPLIGSILGSYLYATLYDKASSNQSASGGTCEGPQCYSTAFYIMAGCSLLGTSSWLLAWRIWARRRIVV